MTLTARILAAAPCPFASGHPIEAEVSFTPELDGQWLQYRHADRAPNIESGSRKLAMTVNDSDNGGGRAAKFTVQLFASH